VPRRPSMTVEQPSSLPARALIVEDDPVFARLLQRALARVAPECRVSVCTSGSAALDLVEERNGRFDLALVDIGLPDLSGIDVIRSARRLFPAMRILVVSVIAAERSVVAAIQAGAQGYVLKDGTDESVASAIGEVLSGHHPISPSLARYLFRLAGAPSDERPSITLSPQQQAVLRQLSRGLTYAEVARELSVSTSTVQAHVRILYRKLGAHSQVQAFVRAREWGLI
jgi:DNA-binding NarL/FixJ family response regulator